MSDLPAWVYDVVIALEEWESVHPKLYQQLPDGQFAKAAACGCGPLEHVPDGVRIVARGIAAYNRATAPTLPPWDVSMDGPACSCPHLAGKDDQGQHVRLGRRLDPKCPVHGEATE